MTTATDKLIADNLWRDIAEAPRDGADILLLGNDESEVKAIADWWHAYANGDGHWEHSENDDGFTPTHFRPLPDDRCANALKVAMEALNNIKVYDCGDAEITCGLAREALAEIERIAGGE